MGKCRILVAEANAVFAEELKREILADRDLILLDLARDGPQAVDMALRLKPDLLILDLLLTGLDGLEVLRLVKEAKLNCRVLMSSAFTNDTILQLCSQGGADFFVSRPCEAAALLRWARRLAPASPSLYSRSAAQNACPVLPDREDLERQVSQCLREIGVPPHLNGFRYLREAVLLTLYDMDLVNSMIKKLYPLVAERFDSAPVRVERSMRSAVNAAWQRGDPKVLFHYFGATLSAGKASPSNAHFIAMLADLIRLSRNQRIV